MRKRPLYITLLLLVACALQSAPDDAMPLSAQDQVPLFLKILSYDKNLGQRGDEIVVGVLYQGRFRGSVTVKDDLVAALHRYDGVGGRAVRAVPVALDARRDLAAQLAKAKVNVLYVAPVRAYDVRSLARLSQASGLLTLTGVPAYLDDGLSVSLGIHGDKPRILINLPSAQAEGADFHSQLLKFAEVRR